MQIATSSCIKYRLCTSLIKKYKAWTPSTCLPNEWLYVCACKPLCCLCPHFLLCVFAFPCQSFSHTKACFYNHRYILGCDFWHCISGVCVCVCVCASVVCELRYEIWMLFWLLLSALLECVTSILIKDSYLRTVLLTVAAGPGIFE